MKTRHTTSSNFNIAADVKAALREVNSYKEHIRVINCGRGVVILPDTNRKVDCTEGEVIKALGLVKKYDGLHLDNTRSEDEMPRKLVSIQYERDTPEIIALTDDQIRLLEWLGEKDYFSECLEYHYFGSSFEIQKI